METHVGKETQSAWTAAHKMAASGAADLCGCRKQDGQRDGDRHGLVVQGRVVKDSVRDEEVNQRGVDGVQEGRQQHQRAGELLLLSRPVQLGPLEAALRTHVLQGRQSTEAQGNQRKPMGE